MAKCCCTSIYNAGCIAACTGLLIEGLEGDFITVTIQHAQSQWTQTIPIVEGSATVTAFNEEGNHLISLGQKVEIEGVEYDCIAVKTAIQVGAANSEPTPMPNFCDAVKACIGEVTQEQPFQEPPFIIYNTNITHNLNGNNLGYIGAEIEPGVFLIRDFDEFGNDIGGIQGSNTIGSGSLFNTIKGIGNSIGDGSSLNIIVGENNSIGDATGFNQISGEDNSIGNQSVSNIVNGFNNHLGENSNINLVSASNVTVGNNSGRNVFIGNNITAGDNVNGCFAAGQDIVIDSAAVFSAAWGVGHNPTCNYSYMYGSYGICQGAAIVLGNGTDSTDKSNAFYVKDNGELMHDGAYINTANQIHTAGGNATIDDNVKTFLYDPATAQTGATVFLPVNKKDGQEITLLFGGTITTGNVINGWTLDGNGATIIGDIPNNIKVGGLTFKYFEGLNRWYKINKGD